MVIDSRPLILHAVYRFDTGGLETGVANLINHMPEDGFRHAVLALTKVTEFRHRVFRNDVQFFELNKPPGQTLWQYPKLFNLIRELRPQIVHSRNLAALEVLPVAWATGVPVRIHSEHGLDLHERGGDNVLYQRIRRIYKPFVNHYVALSDELKNYLIKEVGVTSTRITQVYNGVDGDRFHPVANGPVAISGCPFNPASHCIIGYVGRMQPIKNPLFLAQAFVQAITCVPRMRERLRLVMVGDGPQGEAVKEMLQARGLQDFAWLSGNRSDVPEVLRGFQVFALPSLSEGISNSVLEAMATGLPILATDVGGNSELVTRGVTGLLVPNGDLHGMVQGLLQLASSPQCSARMGQAGRARMEARFSLRKMVDNYTAIYDAQRQRACCAADHA